MRIGFTGAGATGKTTTAKALASREGLTFLPSVAREVFEAFDVREADQHRMTPEECWVIQQEIFKRYSERISSHSAFVSDRTPIDHLCYALYRCAPATSEEAYIELEGQAKAQLAKFDLIVYAPLGAIAPREDDFRQQGSAYRSLIDAAILGFLERWDVPYLYLPSGTVEWRVDQIVKCL